MDSIRARSENKKIDNMVRNVLFDYDDFLPTEIILNNEFYHGFSEYNIKYEDIYFVDKIDQKFHKVAGLLRTSKVIGLDSEFVMTLSKFDQQTTAII